MISSLFAFSLACLLLVGITVGKVYAGEEPGEEFFIGVLHGLHEEHPSF